MSTLKSVGQLDSSESKSNHPTRDVAVGALSECGATRSAPGEKDKKLLDRRWWAWTIRNEYDWMDEHWPFNGRD